MAQQQHSSEEVDLGSIFNTVKEGYHNVLVIFYTFIQFLLKSWLIILILIASGIIIGYIWQNKVDPPKESILYVQINFNAANIIYDAVETLNFKIIERDTIFLKKIGIYNDSKLNLRKIEIEPIVSISDILEKIDQDNQNVETFLEQAQYEDNLLTSEIFISDYRTHKLQITGSSTADNATIKSLLHYLNDNSLINEIKSVTINNTIKKINQNNQNIAYMDSIAKALGSTEKKINTSSQIYFNSVDNNLNNIHLLFREVDENLKDNKKLEIELLKYNNIVQVLNQPYWKVKSSFFDDKIKILPILFIFIYLISTVVRKIYNRGKILTKEKV
tara:strand:+ start:685 stop:1677 length:993 start_codon:yes stop_codon:yes gene_type:complete